MQASLAVRKPPLPQVEELLATYTSLDDTLKSNAKGLAGEMEDLNKTREAGIVSQNTVRTKMDVLQAREPALKSPENQQAYLHYLQLADTRDGLLAQLVDLLGKRRQVLEEERQLLAEVLPPLKKLEEAWRAELLQRPAQQVPLQEQIARVWHNLAALPGKVWKWFTDFIQSGSLSAFFGATWLIWWGC